jgi:hypothetical protein
MSHDIPLRPNFTQPDTTGAGAKRSPAYQTMADALLEAYRTGTPEAMERHYRYLASARVVGHAPVSPARSRETPAVGER